jgi:hypothetical protein
MNRKTDSLLIMTAMGTVLTLALYIVCPQALHAQVCLAKMSSMP